MILDTYRFVESLVAAGFNKKQAETFVQELNTNTGDLVTKQDLESLRREIKSELNVLKWMVGLVCAMCIMIFSLVITGRL